jgi:hypothetical protein
MQLKIRSDKKEQHCRGGARIQTLKLLLLTQQGMIYWTKHELVLPKRSS